MSVQTVFLLTFFILAPFLIIYLERQFAIVKKIGAVLVCYGLGLIIVNLGILPEGI